MATKHITIYHCDACGKKIDSIERFYWGLIDNSPRRHPDNVPENCKEVCPDCKEKLYKSMLAVMDSILGE